MNNATALRRIDQIIADSERRRSEREREQALRLYHAATEGEPVTIFGIRYIPDLEQP